MKPVATAVVKGTAVETVVQTLADDIVSGRLAPGTKLDALSVAERFGVSRTPIRESFSHLASMGLVVHRPNRGVVVATLSADALNDLYEAMAELEAALVRLATLRMNDDERRQLKSMHRQSMQLVRGHEPEAYARFNHRFHSLIFTAARSRHLQELAQTTRSRLAPFRRAQFRLSKRLSQSWEEHDAIVRAILAGDADTAARLMRVHVQTVSAMSAEFVAGHRPREEAAHD